MFIFVGCAGGGSSSLFCQKIAQHVNEEDQNLTAVALDAFTALAKYKAYGDKYDLIFVYGGINALSASSAFEFGQLFDVVFVAPQVRYLTKEKIRLLADYPTVVQDIPPKIFGMMDGQQAYADLLDQLIELDYQRGYQSAIHSASKAADKNMEILVINGNADGRLFTQFFEYLGELGIRPIAEKFSLEGLFDFQPQTDFDIRFLFGNSETLNKADMPKISRRIDSVILPRSLQFPFTEEKAWLKDYQIPYLLVSQQDFYRNEFTQINQLFLTMLIQAAFKTEFTSELRVDYLETEKLKKRKTFLGIFSWE
ncbi:PTS sugar transporter subunit IIB [Enterococcus sp. LJL90]